jgi:hypothetical protein
VNVLLRVCKKILIRVCRRTNAAAIAGRARKIRMRGNTAANRIPNRFEDKRKERRAMMQEGEATLNLEPRTLNAGLWTLDFGLRTYKLRRLNPGQEQSSSYTLRLTLMQK